MPDVIVAPMSLSRFGQKQMLADFWNTDIAGSALSDVALFQGNTNITPTSLLSDLAEANYSGYARQSFSGGISGPYLDPNGVAYGVEFGTFANTTGVVGNNIYSAAILGLIPDGVAATGTVTTTDGVLSAPILTLAGGPYQAPPLVHVTGGGNGAAFHTEITNGAVTAIIMDSPGSGYTTADLVIDPPLQIMAFSNFGVPLPMNVVGDAIPLNCLFTQGSLSNV